MPLTHLRLPQPLQPLPVFDPLQVAFVVQHIVEVLLHRQDVIEVEEQLQGK